MPSKPNLVLTHGWGLNLAVWLPLIPHLEDVFHVHTLSMPGYGDLVENQPSENIDSLADSLLEQAPQNAIWCGWSLGGMATMAAAKKAPERINSMLLLCTTPKFVVSEDWKFGTEFANFQAFSDDLTTNYQRGLKRFLLLQAGSLGQAKNTAKKALSAIEEYPSPSPKTLLSGLDILRDADLRSLATTLAMPTTVISGRRDRVVPPAAGLELSKILPQSSYHSLNSGHAPMLSHPDELAKICIDHLSSYSCSSSNFSQDSADL